MFVLPVITYILGNALRQTTCEPNEKFTKKHPPKKTEKIDSVFTEENSGNSSARYVLPLHTEEG